MKRFLLLAFLLAGCGGNGGYTVPDSKTDTVFTQPFVIVTVTGRVKRIYPQGNFFDLKLDNKGGEIRVSVKVDEAPPTAFVGFTSDFIGRFTTDVGDVGDLAKNIHVRVVGAVRSPGFVRADTIEWLTE